MYITILIFIVLNIPYTILKVVRADRHVIVSWHIRTSVHVYERFAVTDAIVQGRQCSGRRVSRFHR